MMKILGLHHCSVLVKDAQRALDFYHGALGLDICPERPDLGYPGAWLEINGQQIHLMELPDPDSGAERPGHGGRDRHFAFNIDDLDSLKQILDQRNIKYSISKSGRKALFCRDPDGNALEFIEVGP